MFFLFSPNKADSVHSILRLGQSTVSSLHLEKETFMNTINELKIDLKTSSLVCIMSKRSYFGSDLKITQMQNGKSRCSQSESNRLKPDHDCKHRDNSRCRSCAIRICFSSLFLVANYLLFLGTILVSDFHETGNARHSPILSPPTINYSYYQQWYGSSFVDHTFRIGAHNKCGFPTLAFGWNHKTGGYFKDWLISLETLCDVKVVGFLKSEVFEFHRDSTFNDEMYVQRDLSLS